MSHAGGEREGGRRSCPMRDEPRRREPLPHRASCAANAAAAGCPRHPSRCSRPVRKALNIRIRGNLVFSPLFFFQILNFFNLFIP